MNKEIKYYLVPFLFFLLILVIILVLPSGRKEPTVIQKETVSSFPTEVMIPTKTFTQVIPSITLTPIPANNFTGVEEEALPLEIEKLVKQKQELRQRLPLTTDRFSIDFDYFTDKFTVMVFEPRTENSQEFYLWLKDSYPDIPTDRFILNN